MKKIFTILAIAAVSTSAFAQTDDLSATFLNYPAGSTLTTDTTLGWDVVVTNNAITLADSIRTSDTLLVYVTRAGVFYQNYAFNFWGVNIPAGGSITFPFGATIAASSRNDQMCANAIVVPSTATPQPNPLSGDPAALAMFDTNPGDNESCITWSVTLVGISENLKELSNKTFVTNNQLIIENSSFEFNSPATINVISITGQVVATENRVIQRGRNTVQLGNLSTGIYVVSIQVEDKLSTTKVMVK